MKTKRREAPEWAFPWKPARRPPLAGLLAFAIVTVFFVLAISSLRIRIGAPAISSGRKASLIHVRDDDDGRALTLRAREGGPFPSRFDPATWPSLAALETGLRDAERTTLPDYRPSLGSLEPDSPGIPSLAEPGRPVLPRRPLPESPPAPARETQLVPRIQPLAGITRGGVPDELPPFEDPVSPALAADSTRLLLHVDASGRVLDSIALNAGDEADLSPLRNWLRTVVFPPQPAPADKRWVAVRVVFVNQTADGTEPD